MNPQEIADLVTFTEEILNGKLHFLCSGTIFLLGSVGKAIKNIPYNQEENFCPNAHK